MNTGDTDKERGPTEDEEHNDIKTESRERCAGGRQEANITWK